MVIHQDVKITPEVVAAHGLTTDEFALIKKLLSREPNIVELGMYSVLWSEHCSYKSSRPYLKNFPTKSERVLQGPGENAGIVQLVPGLAVSFKIESHNHPSQVEPYQGAATGVGGIVRDVFTMGARPIAGLDSLRFGPLDNPRNRFLLDGVVAGIAGYGNCLGLPTVAGEVYFDECYAGNCLVNAMCVGLVKTDPTADFPDAGDVIIKGSASGEGNPVLYVGSTTGRDGIHGATFASVELNEKSEEKRSNVQVGDPFTEKCLIEACLELAKAGLIVGMQDMGAAGMTSSTSEMASRANMGMEIDLAQVPQREEKMTAYDIMLSESQERMVAVVNKGTEQQAIDIFMKWGLQAVVMGKVTNDGQLRVKIGDQVVADVPARSLADDAPVYNRPVKEPAYLKKLQNTKIIIQKQSNYDKTILKLLSSPNVANKAWVYRQYDHMVQVNTEFLPGVSDAAVLRVKGTDVKLAMKTDGNGTYCFLDPFEGGKQAVAEAARNLSCTGAKPIALTNCLNFGNPEKPEVMWQFKKVIEGMIEACKVLEVPVISGNVSFYNENKGTPIDPTPVIGMLGIIEGDKKLPLGFQNTGDIILVLGDDHGEMGGSEYLKVMQQKKIGLPPRLDLRVEKSVQRVCREAFGLNIIKSAHDISEGGLAITLAECCMLANKKAQGARVHIDPSFNPTTALFSESQSRIVVTISAENIFALQDLAMLSNVPITILGKVVASGLEIVQGKRKVAKLTNKQLNSAYFDTIPQIMSGKKTGKKK